MHRLRLLHGGPEILRLDQRQRRYRWRRHRHRRHPLHVHRPVQHDANQRVRRLLELQPQPRSRYRCSAGLVKHLQGG